jgi:PHD/YefM family antitoxin component YafN of YafNO toxin-antitoxin module
LLRNWASTATNPQFERSGTLRVRRGHVQPLAQSLHTPHHSNDSQSGESTMRVTTAEFIKNYGTLADKALSEPVTITKNGRGRLVVVSAEEYDRLMRRNRRAIRPEELSDEDLALIAAAEVPSEYAHLDAEAADWKP